MLFSNASNCLSKLKSYKSSTTFSPKEFVQFWFTHYVHVNVCLYLCLHTHLLTIYFCIVHHRIWQVIHVEDYIHVVFLFASFSAFHFISLHVLLMILAFRQFPDSSNYSALNSSIEVNRRCSSLVFSLVSFLFSFTHTHKQIPPLYSTHIKIACTLNTVCKWISLIAHSVRAVK